MAKTRIKLDGEQAKRLYNVVNEYKRTNNLSFRDMQERTGVSLGLLGMSNPSLHSHKPCIVSMLYKICESIDVNPYYVLENKRPKYASWRKAFSFSEYRKIK